MRREVTPHNPWDRQSIPSSVGAARDFSTISPSAKALLLVKATTCLPYARKAAEIVWGTEAVRAAEHEEAANVEVARRRRHFEMRAESLDDALAALGASHVLEVAAGLSFRGLAMAERADVHYLDTDLPEMTRLKAELVSAVHPAPLAGTLRVRALDALDADDFAAAADELGAGPIAVVHEGLLMYLDESEKAQLAANVRRVLAARGGVWLTADVYVRSKTHLFRDERTKRFLEDHRVDEQKFADWAAAEAFFRAQGFSVDDRRAPTSDPWRVRETWVMSLARGV